jgi:hypothetical protein
MKPMTFDGTKQLLPLMRRAALLLGLALLQACTTLVATPQAGQAEPSAVDAVTAQAAWARVLDQFVNDKGWVDFAGLARAPGDLHTYVRHVAQTRADDILDRQARLAHHINAYNALSMFNVIDLGIPTTNQPITSRFKFFISRKHLIGGERMSLYAYENDVIRQFGEPRVHWALNCSALSCPVLPRTPFTAAQLEQQLEAESVKFFADPRHFSVDEATRTVHLSEILSFFTEDFTPVHAPNLIAYANRYSPKTANTSYQVKFVPYDWTIANWKR